jgi:hypothetical protein
MGIPFYADAEKLASPEADFNCFWFGGLPAFILMMASYYAFSFFDVVDSPVWKIFGIGLLIGVPILIIYKVKLDVWNYADEKLKQLYLITAASHGISILFVVMTFLLLGRWFDEFSNLHFLGICGGPYFLMLAIYSGVRKEMKSAKPIAG